RISIGEVSVNEASRKFNVPRTTLHQHIKALRCLVPRADETVTIDGVTVPKSITILTQMFTKGKLDYSKARPFIGTRDELREKIFSIIKTLNFRGNIENLVECIIRVYMARDCTARQACQNYKIGETALRFYVKAVRIFIKKWQKWYRNDLVDVFHLCVQVSTDVKADNGRLEPPQLLPVPPKKMMNEYEMKIEEMKEEPIEP
ncbi:hypothetical protein PENTCL1PPCAC_23586, partial [Pristionchus entomophagus]